MFILKTYAGYWIQNQGSSNKRYLFVSDALIEMVGDSSVDSSPWVPPDKYYNPGIIMTIIMTSILTSIITEDPTLLSSVS